MVCTDRKQWGTFVKLLIGGMNALSLTKCVFSKNARNNVKVVKLAEDQSMSGRVKLIKTAYL